MAHYEANNGMTAKSATDLHQGIASTAGGRKQQGPVSGEHPSRAEQARPCHWTKSLVPASARGWQGQDGPGWPANAPPQPEWERLGWGLKPTSSRTGDAGQGWLIAPPITKNSTY